MGRRQPMVASTVLAVLLGGCFGAGSVHADTASGIALYVDNLAAGCSDTGPGSQAEPFCQIQPAAQAVAAGGVVHIARNNTAYAPVTVASKGTADAPISFITAPGNGTIVTVAGGQATAITFSGAQYIDMAGIQASAGAPTAVTFSDAQHITYRYATVRTGATTATTPAIAVDGSSSGIALTHDLVLTTAGLGFASAAGAQDVTLADDRFSLDVGGGIAAAGTTGIHLAGDTISTLCGNAISLTGGTSGSVQNTVVMPGGTRTCSRTDTPAEFTVDASSAPQVTADYNAVNPLSTGTDYDWAGTAYATTQAFQAGTGQGSHDLDQTKLTIPVTGSLTEHSPLIDSADANAPGEPATDYDGKPRVNDPLVADTGTGDSSYDRGATEFQDPLTASGVGMSPSTTGYVGVPATATAQISNPWSDALDGLTYTFDFGDGTTATSTSASATHTYTQATDGSYIPVSVVVDTAGGTRVGGADTWYRVSPLPALTSSIGCGRSPAAPDTASCFYDVGFDPYTVTSDQITFGDGSSAVSPTALSGTVTHRYAAPGTYTVTQKTTDSGGRTATATTKTTVGAAYVTDGPNRLLDTRYGIGAAKRRIGPGGVIRLKILGVDSVPTSQVSAVTLNVTDTGATTSSVVTVYPDGTSRPAASNLNFKAGQTNPNLVTVRVGKDGYVDLYNAHGYVDLIADLEGYFTTSPSTTDERMSSLAAVTPTRVLDTRSGVGAAQGKVGPGSVTTVILPASGRGIATVNAVLNVTVTGGTSNGVITVYCGASTPPPASNLNYRAGQTVSNLVMANVCTGGKFKIYNSAGHVHLIADLQGLYTNELAGTTDDATSPSGTPLVATIPTRFLDTRNGTGAPAKPIGAGNTLAVKVAGIDGIPLGASAVLVNLTGTGPTTTTHLTAFGGNGLPNVSNLNLTTGETRPVLTVIPLDQDGYIHMHNANGSVNVIADLEGYFG
ncbi:PKD domain-containing protein [Streptomyces sp. NPDC005799]|uniref:PKD domain-containing protein n=1 Tax=Streptomyces sp. NPDC005799 TaxID=3154678 RepID=UPI0033E668F9